MADGIGLLRIERDRRFEDYRSLKQYFRNHSIEEIIFETYQITTAALAELAESGGATILYELGAEGTVYVRTEADAAGVRDKEITIVYLDGDGAVQTATIATDDTDSTTETEIATDFKSLRKMTSAVEAPTDNYLLLCNSDNTAKYGIIQDGRVSAAFSRYYVPAATTGYNTKFYLGRVQINCQEENEGDGVESGHQLSVSYTPKECSNITQLINFNSHLDWQPCIELEPETSVVFKIKKIADNDHHELHFRSEILEVDRSE